MSSLFGSLCLVTFSITSMAHLAVGQTLENQSPAVVSHTRSNASQSWAKKLFPNIFKVEKKAKAKATKLVIVSSKGCPPCRRMKFITYPVLVSEGYDVVIRDADEWNEERKRLQPKNPTYIVSSVPTLIYATEKGKILRAEPGFKTPEQVKKYLYKVKKS